MADPTLGLIMILKDEERNLPKSLAPLARLFDEVVAVDTGSKDATARMCRELGARVYDFTWVDDFAAARNFSISKAQSDWLFWLDADNATSPDDLARLRGMIPMQGPAVLWATEKVVPSGERLWQKRCFPNHAGVCFVGRVHEQLSHPKEWPARFTPMVIEHWGYVDPEHVAQTGAYYLSLLKQMLHDDPDDYYAHFQTARCYMNLRRLDKASLHMSKVIASPKAMAQNPALWAYAGCQWARLLKNLGQVERAVAELDSMMAKAPGSGLLAYQRGRMAYDLADYEGAARHLARSLELGPGAPVVDLDLNKIKFLAHYYKARSALNLQKNDEARRDYELALALDPAHLAARTGLARILLQQGERDQARANLRQVLDMRPGDRGALALLERCKT